MFARTLARRYSSQGLATLERRGHVAVVTLNRPDAMNALNPALISDLNATLREVESNAEIRAAVLTGAGKAFAAGADIKFMCEKSFADVYMNDFIAAWEEVLPRMAKPTIAAVNGVALGGGCELALMCDVLVASENARFGQPEIKLGTLPGGGGTQRLTRAIGKSNAMYFCLTGDFLSAADAKEMGMVTKVFPAAELLEEAVKIAQKMAQFSRPVLAMNKEAVNAAFETTLAQGIRTERRLFHASFGLADRVEGMNAFLEKRPAEFKDS
jgi:enoyl-CoA hydratase